MQLPLPELAQLFASPRASPLQRNFALVYVEQAAARAPPAARFEHCFGTLLAGLAARPRAHQDMLLRLAGGALEHLAPSAQACAVAAAPAEQAAFAAQLGIFGPGHSAAADRGVLLNYLLCLMLYQPLSSRQALTPLGLASQQQRQGGAAGGGGPRPMDVDGGGGSDGAVAAGAAAGGTSPPPPGLARRDAALVEGRDGPPAAEALLARKLGALALLARAGADASEALLVYLAAACDPADQAGRGRVGGRGPGGV